jgi:hypothetical protein
MGYYGDLRVVQILVSLEVAKVSPTTHFKGNFPIRYIGLAHKEAKKRLSSTPNYLLLMS